jgi:hypothetical protein
MSNVNLRGSKQPLGTPGVALNEGGDPKVVQPTQLLEGKHAPS